MKVEILRSDIERVVKSPTYPTPTSRVAGRGGIIVPTIKPFIEMTPEERRVFVKGLSSEGMGQKTIAKRLGIRLQRVRVLLGKARNHSGRGSRQKARDNWYGEHEWNIKVIHYGGNNGKAKKVTECGPCRQLHLHQRSEGQRQVDSPD